MAAITGILAQIITGNIDNAGTDGRVYLGIAGREFRLDSKEDDYERGSWREYILGAGPLEPNLPPPQIRVEWPEFNDPRKMFVLDTSHLANTPVYLRFEPEGDSPNWNLSFAAVLVYTGGFYGAYTVPDGCDNLWFGDPMGKALHLPLLFTRERGHDDRIVLDRGRRIAEAMKG